MASRSALVTRLRLLLVILATVIRQTAAVRGRASFYGGNLAGGNCMLTSYTMPAGLFGTAIASSNYNGSSMCGACLNVKGPRGGMRVMVVDSCPSCQNNQLDLFQDAFGNIGERSAGIVDITWNETPCGIKQPLRVRNKDGTSKYWFAMQVYNSNQKVMALDVSTNGGSTWQPTARRNYNYFEKAGGGGGFGADSLTVRITCEGGTQVLLKGVGVAGGSSFTATGNC